MRRSWPVLLLSVVLISAPLGGGPSASGEDDRANAAGRPATRPVAGAGDRPPLTAWEYNVLWHHEIAAYGPKPVSLEEGMNKLGAEGWELVAVEPRREGATAVYYFKRPRRA